CLAVGGREVADGVGPEELVPGADPVPLRLPVPHDLQPVSVPVQGVFRVGRLGPGLEDLLDQLPESVVIHVAVARAARLRVPLAAARLPHMRRPTVPSAPYGRVPTAGMLFPAPLTR